MIRKFFGADWLKVWCRVDDELGDGTAADAGKKIKPKPHCESELEILLRVGSAVRYFVEGSIQQHVTDNSEPGQQPITRLESGVAAEGDRSTMPYN